MSNDANRTPQYLLELAAAGELDPEARRAVLERTARAEGGADPLAELAHNDAAILARLPPPQVAAEVSRRARLRRRSRWLFLPMLGVAAAAASLLLVPLTRDRGPAPSGDDGVRVKGRASPGLMVHRRTRSGAETVAPGAPARPGDLLQLGYVADRRFGVIVSIDGRGGVTRHWPVDGAEAAALTPGREVLLPESFRLDDAPGFERFILVTAERTFEVAHVIDAARAVAARPDARDAPLPLPGGLGEASVVVSKEIR